MTSVRVALIQLRTPANQAAALAQAEPLIRQAAAEGGQLIATPEGSNLLQRDRAKLFEAARSLDEDEFVQRLRNLASSLSVSVLIGSALVKRDDGLMANRSVLIDADGRIQATYDKIHMFDVDLPTGDRYRESSLYAPGDQAAIAHTPWGAIGLTICYDMRFPHLYRALAKAGAQMTAIPAAFTRPTGEAHWEVLLRARAIETATFVLAPAQGGVHEDGRGTWGHSMVVNPWGEIIAQIDGDEPGVVMANLDLQEVDRARAAIPALVNDRVFSGP